MCKFESLHKDESKALLADSSLKAYRKPRALNGLATSFYIHDQSLLLTEYRHPSFTGWRHPWWTKKQIRISYTITHGTQWSTTGLCMCPTKHIHLWHHQMNKVEEARVETDLRLQKVYKPKVSQ